VTSEAHRSEAGATDSNQTTKNNRRTHIRYGKQKSAMQHEIKSHQQNPDMQSKAGSSTTLSELQSNTVHNKTAPGVVNSAGNTYSTHSAKRHQLNLGSFAQCNSRE